jgi:HD superfamily phosphohydrolase
MLIEEKVFKDSVHGFINVNDELIWDLIQTKEFQRLRRIHQLGGTHMTFHTAEHSRFSHSLGVYEIARKLVDETHAIQLTDYEKRLTKCAALLHDVGHGPFSHAFESVFDLDHEEFTQKIILGGTEINQVLKSYDEKLPQDVADVIDKKYKNSLVVSLISSQLDADRMDYLLRDAYNTGVKYGQFDLGRLFRLLRVVDGNIVFKESGIREIENYIVGRYHMYWQLYFHPTSRSYEMILLKLLNRIKYLMRIDYQFMTYPELLEPVYKNEITIDDYFELDEAVILYYFKQFIKEEDDILADLAERFINRRLFKYSNYNEDIAHNKKDRLVDLFMRVGIDPKYYIAYDSSSKIPYDYYNLSKNIPIKVLMNDGIIKELSEVSILVKGISTAKREVDYKVYYPKEMILNLPESEEKQELLSLVD